MRVYHRRQSDTISFDSNHMSQYMKERGLVMGLGHTRENPEILGDPRVMRGRVVDQIKEVQIGGSEIEAQTPRTHTYRRHEFHPSQGTVFIASSTHEQDIRLCNPPTEESRQGASVQYDKARQTRTTLSKGRSAAEGRPLQSRQTTTVRPCPYYLRSHLKEPEGIPEAQRSTGIDSLPQNSLRRRSFSMEALDEDPAHRSE
ncbi:uncharacterized protein TNCV_2193541 [Trichonephila clavipes]|nr:uncharacterized protein TNCV_2193541 [Trichonephila clavipes]